MLTETYSTRLGDCSAPEPISPAARLGMPSYRMGQVRSSSHSLSGDISVTRWIGDADASRIEAVTVPAERYIVSIAMKSTCLVLARGTTTVFNGAMPAGTLHVSAPSRELSVRFLAPFDFMHFHVPTDFLEKHDAMRGSHPGNELREMVLLRDSFVGQLRRVLQKNSGTADSEYMRCIGRALVMHVVRTGRSRTKTKALPTWRLKLVVDHIQLNIEECITLASLAQVAGLSRMQFAAQFRAATGSGPLEYLLHARIEHAKQAMTSSAMPLAEVALAAGFRSQAHFSTVFKRIVNETPARWREFQRSGDRANRAPNENSMLARGAL